MEKGMGVVTGGWRILKRAGRRAIAGMTALALTALLGGCGGDPALDPQPLLSPEDPTASRALVGTVAEVSPPALIQALKPFLDVYEPQVRILSPKAGTTLTEDSLSVRVRVRDLPIYKDDALDLGPHLHLMVDDQAPLAIYDPDTPIELTGLTPGTHTLRLWAVRPWDESFKNEGAFDQVSFDVFAPTPQNRVDGSAPLLTYGQPLHSYGAEPILLDFYLTNTPLHLVAEADEAIADWRLRCTVNGQSFVFDQWQPIYLTGFKPGKNWVKLELIDETGAPIANAFNPAVQVIDYAPTVTDTLAQLIRGDIPLEVARSLVDPTYEAPRPVEEAPADTEAATEPDQTATPADGETNPVDEDGDAVAPAVVEPTDGDAVESIPEPVGMPNSPGEAADGDVAAPEVSEPDGVTAEDAADVLGAEALEKTASDGLIPPEGGDRSGEDTDPAAGDRPLEPTPDVTASEDVDQPEGADQDGENRDPGETAVLGAPAAQAEVDAENGEALPALEPAEAAVGPETGDRGDEPPETSGSEAPGSAVDPKPETSSPPAPVEPPPAPRNRPSLI